MAWRDRDLERARAVVANGRYYDRAALDGLLAAAERAAHQAHYPKFTNPECQAPAH